MSAEIVFTCDGCGRKEDGLSVDHIPSSWHSITEGSGFHKADICEECYKAVFTRKRKKK